MTTKHWAEDSIKKTITLAGIPGEKIEYKTATQSPEEIKSIKAEKSKEKKAENARRASQMDMFDKTNMTSEDIAEMNIFLDERLELSGLKKGALHKDLGVPKDEKIPTSKLSVKSTDSPLEVKRKTFAKNAKNWHHESVTESFNVDELSFVSASPITSSLAESIAMVFEAKKKLGEYSEGEHTTKVYKLTGEHDEGSPYKVQLHKNGKHYEPADYETNDLEDAHGTAKSMVKRAALIV